MLESKIQAAIITIASDLYKLAKQPFSGSELMNLFLPSVFRRPMMLAFKETRGQGMQQQLHIDLKSFAPDAEEMGIYNINSGMLVFSWTHATMQADGWFPRHTQGGDRGFPITEFVDDANPEIREKFLDVVSRLIRISMEWGLVMRVFMDLNQPGYCATPAQMRYVWPSILLLLKRIDDPAARGMVKELTHISARAGDKARIPAPIANLIKPSYDVVTKSVMIFDHENLEIVDRTGQNSAFYMLREPAFTASGLAYSGVA
jgi:hypothetical protein